LFVAGDFFLSPFFFFFFGFVFSPHFWACHPRSSFCELRLHHHRSLFLYFYFCFRRESILLFDCSIWADDEGSASQWSPQAKAATKFVDGTYSGNDEKYPSRSCARKKERNGMDCMHQKTEGICRKISLCW
jgi:hypothetical protein